MPYRIEYSPDAERHLRLLTARQQTTILHAVEVQLLHQPGVETRNRKSLRTNLVAPWELRVGDLRVYYEIAERPEQVVYVRAIGVKVRNRVWIGGEEAAL